MVIGKVLARGQVTLPRMIRRTAGLEPGDVVAFQVTDRGTVEIRPLPRLKLREALERYTIDAPPDDAADRARWQKKAAREVLSESDA